MRRAALLLPLAFAACERAPAGDAIACGRTGALDASCTVERAGAVLTLRQPDGGFHRLAIVDDGRGLASADGAEPVVVRLAGEGRVDASVGGWTYRLPATVAGR